MILLAVSDVYCVSTPGNQVSLIRWLNVKYVFSDESVVFLGSPTLPIKTEHHNITEILLKVALSLHKGTTISFSWVRRLFCQRNKRLLHTFLEKTGWSSTGDTNFMSFREWNERKDSKISITSGIKITRAFPITNVSTYPP